MFTYCVLMDFDTSRRVVDDTMFTYCVLMDFDTSRTAVDETVPIQLNASQRYTDTGLSKRACSANTSPKNVNACYIHRFVFCMNSTSSKLQIKLN